MPVSVCPDCGAQVSDQAPACPHCGRPVNASVQTIERTGKGWKAAQLIGAVLMLLGLVGCMRSCSDASAGQWGAGVFLLGCIVFVAACLGVWWHHG